MDWRIKASIQKLLVYSKIGDRLNHIPATLNKNYHKNKFEYQFYECIRKLEETPLLKNNETQKVALEIGTGYSIIAPVILHLLGFEKIISVDISKDIFFKDFEKQIQYVKNEKFLKILSTKSLFDRKKIDDKINLILSLNNLNDLLDFCNIKYIPNYVIDDIDKEGLQYDYIYSQVVFEHIPPNILNQLFIKMNVWLKDTGYSTHTINFIDHFTNPGFFQDTKISEFNFLKYSNEYWRFWAGNDIAYTNRLSYLYYLNLCEKNNFKIISFKGENYRERKPLNISEIHKDVIKKYDEVENLNELIRYQRGTLTFKKEFPSIEKACK